MIQLLILNGMMIIATLQETGGDIGEPDCLLKEPYEVHLGPENEIVVRPWNLHHLHAYTHEGAADAQNILFEHMHMSALPRRSRGVRQNSTLPGRRLPWSLSWGNEQDFG